MCAEPPVAVRDVPPPAPTHVIPLDKQVTAARRQALRERGAQRVYTGPARLTLGMPCGGLCAGQLYVRGDGTLGGWQIDGRTYFNGVGHTSYRTERPPAEIEQGFALAVTTPDGRTTCATLDDAGYDAIEFVGEYPRALVRYRARQAAVPPVAVELEVFSPFVPLRPLRSAWPATVLHFTLHNPTDRPLDVALGGWLGNPVLADFPEPLDFVRRAQVAPAHPELTGIVLDAAAAPPPALDQDPPRVLADFESGTYAGWTVTGTAFGSGPAAGTLPNQQEVTGFGGKYLVNSYLGGDAATGRMLSAPFTIDRPYLTFRIGGGAHPGRTCLNLLIDGRVERTATGRNRERLEAQVWDVRRFAGRTARLEIVDEETGGWGHINVDDIALVGALGDEYRQFSPQALSFGQVALSVLGPGTVQTAWPGRDGFVAGLGATAPAAPADDGACVGAVVARRTLAPGARESVTFIVSWYFPNLHTGHGRMYTHWFSGAHDVAVRLAADLPALQRDTRRFCDAYYRGTTLPWWLTTRLMMPVANLATGTAQWWRNGRFWAWEGVSCCEGTCTHVWNYAQAGAWLFPELERSARTMQDLDAGFESASGLVGFRSDRNFAADGQAGTILKCYREHRNSPDDAFLRQNWSRIRLALDYLISHDADENGVIENDRQHNTYDINFVGPNTFVGALYLAALRAGEEMARHMGDTESAARYRTLFERGRAWTAAHLFNGEYFEQLVPDGDERPWQYGRGCLADQLFGQNWAHALDLGYLYPPEQVRSALGAVFRYNWAPDVGPYNAQFPPERCYARPGEAGLLICTWPRGGRPPEPVRYRDEVWTGIEYQVAAGLLWEGFVDEALLIVRGIDDRYDGAKHNPWNEVECGDHYARALASWGVLHALAGFTFDGPAGRLAFAPRMQPDDFAVFFCAATGWGTLRQSRTAAEQGNRITLDFGTLRLTEIVLELPPDVVARRVAATLATDADAVTPARAVAVRYAPAGARCRIVPEAPLELAAGQRLLLRLSW